MTDETRETVAHAAWLCVAICAGWALLARFTDRTFFWPCVTWGLILLPVAIGATVSA